MKEKKSNLFIGTYSKNLDFNTIRLIYLHNREKILPLAIIFFSFFLFFFFIFPQILDFSNLKQQELTLREQIQSLQNKLALLQGLDQSELESKLNLASSALPPNKDFASIITSVSFVAAASGVDLDDFSFAVGELSTSSAVVSAPPSLSINLKIKGSLENTKAFLENLYIKMPLAEVTSIEAGGGLSTLSTLFYYKPFPPISINPLSPVQPLSKDSASLINTLSDWSILPVSNFSSTQSAF